MSDPGNTDDEAVYSDLGVDGPVSPPYPTTGDPVTDEWLNSMTVAERAEVLYRQSPLSLTKEVFDQRHNLKLQLDKVMNDADQSWNQTQANIKQERNIMADSKIPSGLHVRNIGKLVTVQVLKRVSKDSDTLDLDTLQKYVGVLEAYSFDRLAISVKLRGLPMITGARSMHTVEIYI